MSPLPDKTVLGVSVSHNNEQLDFNLLKAGGVKLVSIKTSQGDYDTDTTLLANLSKAAAAQMPFGYFHWCDPMVDDQHQIDHVLNLLDGLPKPLFVAVDIEQYWQLWSEWRASIAGTGVITKFVPAVRISDNARKLAEALAIHGYQVVIYTRAYFIKDHCTRLLDWIRPYKKWWAQWPYPAGLVTTNWPTFIANWLPKQPGPSFPKGWLDPVDWDMWQITGDKFVLPGCKNALDIDIIKESMLTQTVPPPPPTLTLEERVSRLEETVAILRGILNV